VEIHVHSYENEATVGYNSGSGFFWLFGGNKAVRFLTAHPDHLSILLMHALHCFISNRCNLLSGKAKEIADIVLREALLEEVSDTPSEELH